MFEVRAHYPMISKFTLMLLCNRMYFIVINKFKMLGNKETKTETKKYTRTNRPINRAIISECLLQIFFSLSGPPTDILPGGARFSCTPCKIRAPPVNFSCTPCDFFLAPPNLF